ncbi:ABC transporter permease [Streptacidiphilus jiangxiensis]|uniref:ABC transporter permease n=1 Tax=Streptacidiphilus jiangxiensis TaxID=235985 RepID=UPI0005AB2F52|nr:FtsX-like permease family protein [Streptacidiphilus jiangxiensis]
MRRSGRHGLVLAAAAATVLLAGLVLAVLAALTEGSVDSGVAAALTADPSAQVRVTMPYRADTSAAADARIRAALDRAFAPVPHDLGTGLLGLLPLAVTSPQPGADGLSLFPLALPVTTAQAHARLVAGTWPTAGAPSAGGAVPAAVPLALAQRLRLRPGSLLQVADALGHSVRIRVSGVFRPDGAAAFWPAMAGDPAGTAGTADRVLVLSPGALTATAAFGGHVLAEWTALPDTAHVVAADLAPLADRISALGDGVRQPGRAVPVDAAVQTGLVGSLRGLVGPSVVARSVLYLPTALLAALALVTVGLTGRQLAVHRQGELVLQQTRGAGTGRLLRDAAAEWSCTALPAAGVALLLAGPLLRVLHALGWLAVPVPGDAVGASAWLAVGATLLVHGAATLAPVLSAVTGHGLGARLRLRGPRAAAVGRHGADLALLLVAVLGYLQLAHYHAAVTGSGGALGVDPVLVLVPTVATVAAALLLLRLLPPAARALDRLGRALGGLVVPLAGWQVGRRSAKVAGPVLLMSVAVAVGTLATTVLACVNGLAGDQADFQVGADVRVTLPAAAGLPAAAAQQALLALPGVTGATPVTRTPATTASGGLDEIVAVDTGVTAAGGAPPPVPRLRADLAGPGYASALAALGRDVAPQGLTLPGAPATLVLDETLGSDGDRSAPQLQLTVQDATGVSDTVTVTLPAADGARHQVGVPLGLPGAERRASPLTITGLTLVPTPGRPAADLDFALHRVGAGGAWLSALPGALAWSDHSPSVSGARSTLCQGAGGPQAGACAGGADLLDAGLRTGAPGGTTQAGTELEADLAPSAQDALPVLADSAALADGHHRVGDQVALGLVDGRQLTVRIIGEIAAVPGQDHELGAFLTDQRRLAATLAGLGEPQLPPTSWWLASSRPAATAAAVAARPQLGEAVTRDEQAARLRADPFKQGMRTVLDLCRLLAPGFAVIGFTVHCVVGVRERRRDFALLRAMGLRPGQLSALLWLEQVGVCLFALVPGALLGTALAVGVLPSVSVDDQGTAPFPPLRVDVPWGQVAVTSVVVCAAILLVVSALSRLLARVDLVRVLRAGEDV